MLTDPEIKLNIESVLLPYLEERKIDLVDLNLQRYRSRLTVDVIVDMERGGIRLDACAGVNKFLNRTLEENAWIEGDYLVEVSSPGLDRPLKHFKDFRRVTGRPVAVYLAENDLGLKLEYRGILEAADESQIIIDQVPVDMDIKGKNKKKAPVSKGKIAIPVRLINKGMQII